MRKFAVAAVTAACLVAGLPADAKQLYRYQDENGIWHLSDQPPKTGRPVTVERLHVFERKRQVFVIDQGTRERPILYVRNNYHGPIQIEFRLTEATNVATRPKTPVRLMVLARGERRALELWQAVDGRAWSYRYRYDYVPGAPGAKHAPEAPYRPPFAPGATFQVGQAFHGAFSHQTPEDRYAVDFPMPEGSSIHSARGGIVMEVAEDFYQGGSDRERHGRRANLIRILHADGTMGLYLHLKDESARVAPGDRVRAGQWIADSGNTGFSTGPHLHFVVQRNVGMALESVPFEFAGEDGRPVTPETGMMLRAPTR